jgi:peptidoglycan/xylan/chitin deacetylase (PgdA/CDA1 family)
MILFLTYHKVLRGPESEAEFYTLQAGKLQRLLELLAEKGLRQLPLRELLHNGGVRPSPGAAGSDSVETPDSREPVPLSGVAAPGDGRTPPAVPFLLSFDDGTVDHYEVVFPLLAQADQKAIFFVPTAKLNRPGYLTNDMVREMAKAGHTIGLHGHEHRRLDEFGEEDIRVQMEISRAILANLTGAPPVVFAPPGGFMDRRVQAVALETGVRVIRTMRWGYNRRLDLTALECIPLNRSSAEAEFRRVLEFRSQALAYTAKQIARKLVPAGLYGPLRESVSRARGGK